MNVGGEDDSEEPAPPPAAAAAADRGGGSPRAGRPNEAKSIRWRISALASILDPSGPASSALSPEQLAAVEASLRDLRGGGGATPEASAASLAGTDGGGGAPGEDGGDGRGEARRGGGGGEGEPPPRKTAKRSFKPWSLRFQELLAFKREYGHTRVFSSYAANPQLGRWVMRQRQEYKWRKRGMKNGMTDEKIRMLEGIGFRWEPSDAPQDDRWMCRLEELMAYKARRGHVRVGKGEGPLGRWVNNQRREYKMKKEGKPSAMTDTRVELLEALGFSWTASTVSPPDQKWNERLEELRFYAEESGSSDIPRDFENRRLVYWVDRQRLELQNKRKGLQRKKGQPAYMTLARKAALRSVGFDMTKEPCFPAVDLLWMQRLEELEIFHEENGSFEVPTEYPPNPALGAWVSQQRRNRRLMMEGKVSDMTEEQEALLHGIGFVWEPDGDRGEASQDEDGWDECFVALRQYKEHHGDTDVPLRYAPDHKLGLWAEMQRRAYRDFLRP